MFLTNQRTAHRTMLQTTYSLCDNDSSRLVEQLFQHKLPYSNWSYKILALYVLRFELWLSICWFNFPIGFTYVSILYIFSELLSIYFLMLHLVPTGITSRDVRCSFRVAPFTFYNSFHPLLNYFHSNYFCLFFKHFQWCNQNAENVTHLKGRLLNQAVILFNCFPFHNGNFS